MPKHGDRHLESTVSDQADHTGLARVNTDVMTALGILRWEGFRPSGCSLQCNYIAQWGKRTAIVFFLWSTDPRSSQIEWIGFQVQEIYPRNLLTMNKALDGCFRHKIVDLSWRWWKWRPASTDQVKVGAWTCHVPTDLSWVVEAWLTHTIPLSMPKLPLGSSEFCPWKSSNNCCCCWWHTCCSLMVV